MKLKKIGYVAACLLLFNQVALADSQMTTYQDANGSTLELQINSDNSLSGFFTPAAAAPQCQQIIGVRTPIIGYINNNALTFSVDFQDCSVVSFTGNMQSNQQAITTTSVVARPVTDTSQQGGKQGKGRGQRQGQGQQGQDSDMVSHDVFQVKS